MEESASEKSKMDNDDNLDREFLAKSDAERYNQILAEHQELLKLQKEKADLDATYEAESKLHDEEIQFDEVRTLGQEIASLEIATREAVPPHDVLEPVLHAQRRIVTEIQNSGLPMNDPMVQRMLELDFMQDFKNAGLTFALNLTNPFDHLRRQMEQQAQAQVEAEIEEEGVAEDVMEVDPGLGEEPHEQEQRENQQDR
ncbi:hypothetical protein LTR47_002362 [Exophiala xenobiotica]|nr:hypothetical protein LTR47_002362 [Exophiala xenobiotica]KAK5242458.1 hypothetical protein LTS06_011508 [Exophiala xenobiotica]KAK5280430.1 hypothetical protein LTR40_006360 [Exophiala xenobiotica]KAK5350522.1 hypothetical protein LTR61_005719 [Exophiala xenobiotica]KAK5378065.1 hypothetical protein LTS03_004941 [Exophiala xenobiotica]